MPGSIVVDSRFVECPHCGVVLRAPASLVATLVYPDDVEEVDLLLRGELNAVRHLCGDWVSFGGHLVVYNHRAAAAISTLDLRELLPAEQVDALDVTDVEGYAGVCDALYAWLWADASTAMSPGPALTALFDLDPAGFLDAVPPIALVAIRAHRDGYLPVRFEAPPGVTEEEVQELVSDVGLQVAVRAIRQVVELVVNEDRAPEVLEEMERRIPRCCLDEATLAALSEVAHEALTDPELHVMARWRTGVADAAAYALAERTSPEAGGFVRLLQALWDLSRHENVALDPRVWLTPEVMRRLADVSSLLALFARQHDDLVGRPQATVAAMSELAGLLGHEDVLADAMVQMRLELPGATSADVDQVVDALLTVADERLADISDPWERAWTYSGALWGAISGLPEAQARRAYERARAAIPADRALEAYALDCAVCQRANQAQRTSLGGLCAERILGAWTDDVVGPEHALFGVNEAGNTFRLLGAYPEALKLYDLAEELDQFVEADHGEIIARNRAIVLRDMGDLVGARELLMRLVADEPDSFDTWESLAVVDVRAGDYAAARSVAERVLSRPGIAPAVTRRFRRFAGFCLALEGDADAALTYLSAELDAEPSGSPLRFTVLSVLMRADSSNPETGRLVEHCAEEVVATAELIAASSRSVALTGVASVALRRIRQGDRPGAESAYRLCLRILHDQTNRPWQVELARAWLTLGSDDDEALDAMRTAVAILEERIPGSDQAAYALTWIGDADISLLQSVAAQLAVSGSTSRVHVDDVLAAFDLQNGRELTSLAARARPVPGIEETSGRLAEAQRALGADVVAVLDTIDACSLLLLSRDGGASLVTLGDLDEIQAALRPLSYPVNPVAPQSSDRLMGPWWDLAGRFAAIVREHLPEDRPLVILEGSRLVATPLHAAGWPEAPLVLDRPVSFAVNSRLLAATPVAGAGAGRQALICPKRGDRAEFVRRLDDCAGAFRDAGYAVTTGTAVDEPAVVAALGSAAEVVIVCHGVSSATAAEGPGICVAAGGTLPPSALLADRDPDLHAFVVTWRDLASLESTPEVVVSLACSTGRTRAGRGGTRIGLDQALVGRMTTHLVSPLWNVAQESALDWLDGYIEARATRSAAEAYRAAMLKTADRYDHPYHWAPFTLRTHYQGTPLPGGTDGSPA